MTFTMPSFPRDRSVGLEYLFVPSLRGLAQIFIIASTNIIVFPIPDGNTEGPPKPTKTIPAPPLPGVDGKSTLRSAR
jgi:hypothetical protein